jgi:hypothetical protein
MEPLVHMLIILARKDARCDEVGSLQARAAAPIRTSLMLLTTTNAS